MPTTNVLDIAGLHTANNELSSVPSGALVTATNCVIKSKDVIESRRGQYKHTYNLGGSGDVNEIHFFGDTVIVQRGNSLYRDNPGVAFVDYSVSFSPAAGTRYKAVEAQKAFYVATNKGVYKLATSTGTFSAAGGLRPGSLSGATVTAASTGFLGTESTCAYRYTCAIKDANGTLIEGPPSGRLVVTNTSTTNSRNYDIGGYSPEGATTSHLLRLYRTAQVGKISTAGDIDPGEEMGLVYERYFTSAELTGTRTFSIVDTTPDDFRGASLHTNPNSGEGALGANEPPPRCHDLAYWNGRLWYGYTNQFQRFFLDLIGVGAGADGETGVRWGDTLTINGRTYVAKSGSGSAPSGNATYVAEASGDPDANVTTAARNLVAAINTDSSATVRASYISSPSTPSGKILIESKSLDASIFYVTLDTYAFSVGLSRTDGTATATINGGIRHNFAVGDTFVLDATSTVDPNFPEGTYTVATVPGDTSFTFTISGVPAGSYSTVNSYTAKRSTPAAKKAWIPELPTSGTTAASDSDTAPNRLYYSKYQQLESVPLLNYIDVGVKNKAILRVIPLRDKLYVFKEEGIYVVSGDSPFRVDLLDDTTWLLARDTAVGVSNQIFCLTNQGVCAVSDTGVRIVSRQIEPDIVEVMSAGSITPIKTSAFGVAHETDRLYSLWLPAYGGSICTRAYVYNTVSGVWTYWSLTRNCGRVRKSDDLLYMNYSDHTTLVRERKDYSHYDYYDDSVDLGASTYNSSTKTFTFGSVAGVSIGDVIQAGTGFGVVTAVTATTVTVDSITGSFGSSPANTYHQKAIPITVEWAAFTAGDPGSTKQFREIKLHWKAKEARTVKVTCKTDLNTTASSAVALTDTAFVTSVQHRLWSTRREPKQTRHLVPQAYQRGSLLHVKIEVSEAMSLIGLLGMSVVWEPGSERTRR